MNPLQKLKQFFINLFSSKPNKITSSNKISQRVLPDVQNKQVENKQQQKTITSFTEQVPEPVTESSPTIIRVGKESISDLEPGHHFLDW